MTTEINTKRSSNVCTRCGKERIFSKTWKETITTFMGTSEITYTEMVCPDKECQEIVQKQLDASKKRKAEIEKDKEDRKAAAKENNRNRLLQKRNPS